MEKMEKPKFTIHNDDPESISTDQGEYYHRRKMRRIGMALILIGGLGLLGLIWLIVSGAS